MLVSVDYRILGGAATVDSRRVWEAISNLPSLKSVELEGNECYGIPDYLLQYLGAPSPDTDSATGVHIPFPSLESLIYETTYKKKSPRPLSSVVTSIVSAIESRTEAGIKPVPTMKLHLTEQHEGKRIRVSGSDVQVEKMR